MCQIQPSGSPNPGGGHSICQGWEMPPPDTPPRGQGTIWSPFTRPGMGPVGLPHELGANSWAPDVQHGCKAP